MKPTPLIDLYEKMFDEKCKGIKKKVLHLISDNGTSINFGFWFNFEQKFRPTLKIVMIPKPKPKAKPKPKFRPKPKVSNHCLKYCC